MIEAECLGKGHDTTWCHWKDVKIIGISVTPSSVKPGEKITIKAEIKCYGDWYVSCSNFTLKFYLGDTYIGCYQDRLTKGETWFVPFEYTIPVGTSPGSWLITAKETHSSTLKITSVIVEESGKATITSISKPATFTPGVTFKITTRARNDGGSDNLFIQLVNKDTDAIIKKYTSPGLIPPGGEHAYTMVITLTQTTDFHGRIEAGHIE